MSAEEKQRREEKIHGCYGEQHSHEEGCGPHGHGHSHNEGYGPHGHGHSHNEGYGLHGHGHSHHHHDGGCGCGEFQEEGGIRVTTHRQDAAVVVSAHYDVVTDRQKLAALLEAGMESAASEIYEAGGLIGHLKASMDVHTVEVFSLTDREVYRKSGSDCRITVTAAAILFALEEAEAEERIRTMLEEIDKKVRK